MTSGLWLRVLAALATIAAVIDASNNFHVTVPPRRKECFFEPMEPGQQLGLSFQVFGGESLEVDFLVSDPNDLIVKSIMRSSTGSLSIEATKVGTYKYCISNMGTSGGSEKQVSFSLLGPDEQKRRSDKGQAGNEEVMSAKDSLQKEVDELTDIIQQVSDEQAYIRARLNRHHKTAESTNSRVLYWTILEGLLIAGVVGFQIVYITQLRF